jgi:hypothetical protein
VSLGCSDREVRVPTYLSRVFWEGPRHLHVGRYEPAARGILEDAGDLFEDLGDEPTVRAIDLTLREVQNDFEESPRSFHALVR